MFYVTNADELWSATIQSVWSPNLEYILANRTLRLMVWCTNDEEPEALFFRVGDESLTCGDVPDLCTVREEQRNNNNGKTKYTAMDTSQTPSILPAMFESSSDRGGGALLA